MIVEQGFAVLVVGAFGRYFFSFIGQEYPFLQVSAIFLSRPAVSALALKAVSICQSLFNIAQSC